MATPEEVEEYNDLVIAKARREAREEANKIIKIRAEELKQSKADQYKAELEARAAKGWFLFLQDHQGTKAVMDGIQYHSCEANNRLMEDYISKLPSPIVDRASLEQAYQALKHQLGSAPKEEYQRKTNTQESRIAPQQKKMEPKVFLPYSREEILSWSKERLKKEMKSKLHTDALNAILAGR